MSGGLSGSSRGALIGRQDELAALRAVLESAAGGVPGIALLGGDAGAGKSRLLEDLTEQARADGWTVLIGNCVPIGDHGLPYLPIIDLLRQIESSDPELVADHVARRPALGALLTHLAQQQVEPVAVQGQLFEAILRLLLELAARSPLLVVVEDLHWADRSTRDLMSFLARTVRAGQLVLMASYRTDDLHRRHPLRPLVVELARLPQVTRVDVPLLTRDELAELVELHTGEPADLLQVEDLHRRTDGNAFYSEELLRAGSRLPTALSDLLLDRVGDLSDSGRAVLRVAAVAGRQIEESLLFTVAGLPRLDLEEALREALEAGLLVIARMSATYTFRHALLQEAVYEDLLPGERSRLHARFADALADSSCDLAERAHHQVSAHQEEAALATLIAAADRAKEIAAPTEALRHLEQALDLADRFPGPDRLRLLTEAAAAAHGAGESRRATVLAQEAIVEADSRADATEVDGIRRRAAARERLAHYLMDIDSALPASGPATEALDLLDQVPESVLTARALATSARSLLWVDVDLTGHLLERTVEVADRTGASYLAADALVSRALLARRGIVAEDGVALLGRALDRAGADAEGMAVRLRALRFATHHHLEDRTPTAALATADEGIELAAEAGLTWTAYGVDLHLLRGWALLAAGRWDEVLEVASSARFEPAPSARQLGLLALEVMTARSDPAAAAVVVRLQDVPDEYVQLQLQRAHLRGLLRAGEPDEILNVAPDLYRRLVKVGMKTEALLTLGVEVQAAAAVALRTGPTADLRARVAALIDEADQHATIPALAGPYGQLLISMLRAEATPVTGHDPAAAWTAVLDLAQGAERVPERAQAAARLVEIMLDAGQRGRPVLELASKARVDFVAMGLPAAVARLDGLLRRARLTAADPDRVPDLLTSREHQVLVLVAAGRTNGEIGKELFISVKTASVHVSNILAKLGASSRTEAAALARRQGLLDG